MRFGILRPIEQTELELMLSWRNAPGVRANMYTQHEISKAEHLAWWERIQQRSDQIYFMYEAQGEPLGIVGFNDINDASRHSFWAFYAAPNAPKGTGSKMEFLALDHAFEKLTLHKLSCEVLAFNTPVIKLHQKFGFTIEGILREQQNIESEFIDVIRLGILQSEWQAQREAMLDRLTEFSGS